MNKRSFPVPTTEVTDLGWSGHDFNNSLIRFNVLNRIDMLYEGKETEAFSSRFIVGTTEKNHKNVVDFLVAQGFKLLYESSEFKPLLAELNSSYAQKQIYYDIRKDAYIDISVDPYAKPSLFTVSTYGKLSDLRALEEELKKLVEHEEKAPEGSVYALTTNSQGRLQISVIGQNGVKIERGNYSPQALDGYDYIVEQFNKPDPDGRIAIFDGKPGTGKTYLVRSLLLDIQEADIIILPSSLVASFNMPEMLTTLVDHKADYGQKMVLVIEDADQVITKRAGDNISAVSNLLNLGDGILGTVLDIRIICTTNATVADLDEAITRPGRLCKHVSVDELQIEQAMEVFKRLTKDVPFPTTNRTKFSIAEVYKLAKDTKFALKAEKKKVGF
jgi:ATPase family associated with various cellular activities (AAA)